ncbi:integrase, catalytic region, zinc finger, CCHC-type containing protein [Tanacetum coccineum]
MACDVSWKSRLSTVNDENVYLKTQMDSVVKERENVKLEYQKLFNSIKATRTEHQKELDELIEHVNRKTYAYVDGKNVNIKFDKSETSGTLLYVTPLPKNIKDVFLLSYKKCVARYALSRDSKVTRALFTTPIAARSKNLGATYVVTKSRLSVAKTPIATNKVSSALPLSPDSSQIDDYSRYTWLYFLRTKDEAPNMIIDFINKIQQNLKAQILKIQTDNGTEFKNEKLRSFYAKLGIVHNTFIARTTQQNGVVERRNRTLVEVARTMLIFSKTPKFLWAEAIATACFTQNCSIVHNQYNKTPYELIRGRKPILLCVWIFVLSNK